MNDATIKGGAAYPVSVKKTLRGQTIVMENRLPSVNMIDSAGAYLPLQSECSPTWTAGAGYFTTRPSFQKWGSPDNGRDGVVHRRRGLRRRHVRRDSPREGHGAIFLGGPPLVGAATGEEVTADQLGGAMFTAWNRGLGLFRRRRRGGHSHSQKHSKNLPRTEKARVSSCEPAAHLRP